MKVGAALAFIGRRFIWKLMAATIAAGFGGCATIVQTDRFETAVSSINQQLESAPLSTGLARFESVGRCEGNYSTLSNPLESVLRGYERLNESVLVDFENNALSAAEVPVHDEYIAGHPVHQGRSIRISLTNPTVAFITGTDITTGKPRPQYTPVGFVNIAVAENADEQTVRRLVRSLNQIIITCQRARDSHQAAAPPLLVPLHYPDTVAFSDRIKPGAIIIGVVPGSMSVPTPDSTTSVEFFEAMALDPLLRFQLDLSELRSTIERAATTMNLGPGLRIEPADTRLATVVVGALEGPGTRPGPRYVAFADAASGDWLLPVYFDRPCRITNGTLAGKAALTINILVKAAGLRWIRIPMAGRGAVVVEDALPPLQVLIDLDAQQVMSKPVDPYEEHELNVQ